MTDQSGVATPTTPQEDVDVSARKVAHVSLSDDSLEHRGGRASDERSFTNDVIKADTAEVEEEEKELYLSTQFLKLIVVVCLIRPFS